MSNRVCHFKLVLLGDAAVGKSCLVVRFVRDEFFEFQEPTIGGKKILRNLISFRSLRVPGFESSNQADQFLLMQYSIGPELLIDLCWVISLTRL